MTISKDDIIKALGDGLSFYAFTSDETSSDPRVKRMESFVRNIRDRLVNGEQIGDR